MTQIITKGRRERGWGGKKGKVRGEVEVNEGARNTKRVWKEKAK